MAKSPKQRTLRNKCDKLWAQIIRSRGFCERCGKSGQLQAAHIFSRRYSKIRHDRLVVGAQPDQRVDHINRDTLDNRRANLRFSSQSQNMANAIKPKNNTSGYKGVSWEKRRNKWAAYIEVNYRKKHLGYFNDPVDAAHAYDAAARKHFGEFALTNFPQSKSPA